MWSLGLVFLDMTTVLRGKTIAEFRSYLTQNGTQHQFAHGNLAAMSLWMELLQTNGVGPPSDNEPLVWIKDMTQEKRSDRPNARNLVKAILSSSSGSEFRQICCTHAGDDWDDTISELPEDALSVVEPDAEFSRTIPIIDAMETRVPSKNDMKMQSVESWLQQGQGVPFLGEERSNMYKEAQVETESIFEIEEDEDDQSDARSMRNLQLRPTPVRIQDFDILERPPAPLSRDELLLNDTDIECPFDIDSDGDSSDDSEETVRPKGYSESAFDIIEDSSEDNFRPSDYSGSLFDIVEDESDYEVEEAHIEPADFILEEETTSNKKQTGTNRWKASQQSNRTKSKGEKPTTITGYRLTASDLNKLNPQSREEVSDQIGTRAGKTIKGNSKRKPKKKERFSAKEYIQNTWEAESSAATSVLSESIKTTYDYLGLFAKQGKAAAVVSLLEGNSNPGTRENPRKKPIINAVKGGTPQHVKCVRALLKRGANINITSDGKTPLHIAVEHDDFKGYTKLIWELLNAAADPNAKDSRGDTALLKILHGGYDPLPKHRRAALALLLHFGANVNVAPRGTLNKPLHLAVRRKDLWAVGMLLEKGALVNELNGSGSTPLALCMNAWSAAGRGRQLDVLELLLEAGAPVDQKVSTAGETALHIAASCGSVDAVDTLLDYGALPLSVDNRGRTVFSSACQSVKSGKSDPKTHGQIMDLLLGATAMKFADESGRCPIVTAVEDADLAAAKTLLILGADANHRSKGQRLLHIAASGKSLDLVRLLVQRGADILALNDDQRSAARCARDSRNVEIAEFLEEQQRNRTS